MRIRTMAALMIMLGAVSGCALLGHAFCAPGCQTQAHNTSSLVSFLYPDGKTLPPNNTIPELHVPLRVGLAFLPSQSSAGATQLSAAQKQELLERIRQRFATRPFVSEIIVIPDYYLSGARGFAGLDGVQRLYNIDLMALVSYDQVTHTDDNKLSLGYLTIVGAYWLPGSSHDTATLVDLAVIDPATRSLVLRAGGTSTNHGSSTLVDVERESRKASASGFNDATDQMIEHFDAALTAFQTDVHNGNANVRVISRNTTGTKASGGGALDPLDIAALLLLLVLAKRASGKAGGKMPSKAIAPQAPPHPTSLPGCAADTPEATDNRTRYIHPGCREV
jgi:rhombotail lipoprotein